MAGKTWVTYRASVLHSFREELVPTAYAEALSNHMAIECRQAVGKRWRFLAAAYLMPQPVGMSSTPKTLVQVTLTAFLCPTCKSAVRYVPSPSASGP